MTTQQRLRIAVADDEPDMRMFLSELLPHLGHDVMAVSTGRELVELCRAAPPDLVIADIKMPDGDGITAAAEINRELEVPVILVSAHHDPELRSRAGQGHVMAYLVKPVKPADLEVAIDLALTRFGQYRVLRQEATDLRQALEDRKVIERAKGVLMRRSGLDEQEAFRRLRMVSSSQNRKLAEVAQDIHKAEEAFGALEGVGAARGEPEASAAGGRRHTSGR